MDKGQGDGYSGALRIPEVPLGADPTPIEVYGMTLIDQQALDQAPDMYHSPGALLAPYQWQTELV